MRPAKSAVRRGVREQCPEGHGPGLARGEDPGAPPPGHVAPRSRRERARNIEVKLRGRHPGVTWPFPRRATLRPVMTLASLGPWGLLPVAFPLLLAVAALSAHRIFPPRPGEAPLGPVDRLAAGAVLGMVVVHGTVAVLGTLGLLSAGTVLGLTLTAAVALALVPGPRPDVRTTARALLAVSRSAWPALALGLGVLAVAATAARLLPVWQWDALGYHLPFVDFVLQAHGFAGVPPDVHYTTTYPHDIELGMVWLRALLPDDRLVDLAQVPYGLAGALLTAAVARRLGAGEALAALAGAAWLTLPSVFLQLPTDYVDVGTAAALLGALYFLLLAPPSLAAAVVGGLALGLFLGSKPSAPLATALVGAVASWRLLRARQGRGVAALTVATLCLGGEMYLVMWLRHGNPVWPVALQLGPLHLPGEYSVEELLASGASVPRATGTLLQRLGVSWLALDAPPVFDMKVGGLGLPFLLALPLAVAGLVSRRSLLLVLAAAATLLSPDAAVARYVLAFGALVLALALATVEGTPRRRALVTVVALATCAWQLHASWPGLAAEGPPLEAFWGQSDAERRFALGPSGRTDGYREAWAAVREGEAAAFDADFEFPGLLWAPDLRFPVYLLSGEGAEAERWLEATRVRVLAVGPRRQALVGAQPGRWRKLFGCQTVACAVYVRWDDPGTLSRR